MKIRRTAATAVIAGLSAVGLNGVATAAPVETKPAQEAAAADDTSGATRAETEATDKADKPADGKKPDTAEGLPKDPKEIVGSIADLLAFLPGLLPADAQGGAASAKSLEDGKLPQNAEELLGSASDLLSSGAAGESEAPSETTGASESAGAGEAGAPTTAATETNGASAADETTDAAAPKASETAPATDGATEAETDDADKVTVPAADGKQASTAGKAAAERVIEEQEKKAGHALVEVNFVDDKTASISLAETFDQEADADALKEIAQTLHDNGFTVTAERVAN